MTTTRTPTSPLSANQWRVLALIHDARDGQLKTTADTGVASASLVRRGLARYANRPGRYVIATAAGCAALAEHRHKVGIS